MERWEWDKTHRRSRDRVPNPSFSSSLLDAIYRSIDEGDNTATATTCRVTNKPQRKSEAPDIPLPNKHHHHNNYRYAAAAAPRCRAAESYAMNSTSSSSESSYGGFSSSEPESGRHRLPPVVPGRAMSDVGAKKAKAEGSIRSRFRPSRIYGELKKARAPASPGGRLASFLNSLFAHSPGHRRGQKPTEEPTCSSASSFSRSCLSKTPSSRGRPAGGDALRRSVRFYPVSVIVGDDAQPCGEKCLDYAPPPPVRIRAAEKEDEKRKREAARNLIVTACDSKLGLGFGDDEEEEEEDDDDGASCSSSDLFELESLTGTGVGERYRDELPVYETTHVRTNRAIARGLIV